MRNSLLLGIYGRYDIVDERDNIPDVSLVLEGPFPSCFIPAGKYMRPDIVLDGSGNPIVMSSSVKGRRCVYALYRFVLPYTANCDLGCIYVPLWEECKAKQNEVMALLPRVFLDGYNGTSVKTWLLAHVHEIIKYCMALRSEWKYPIKGFNINRYLFKRCGKEYERNLGLLIGQLFRFGGDEVVAALRIAGGGDFLRKAGLWTKH